MEGTKNFKLYAKEAKSRFKNGYWKQFCVARDERLKQSIKEGKREEEVKKIIVKETRNDINKKFNNLTEDDILYNEVCELLGGDEIVFNPVNRLINHNVYETLNEQEKKNYITVLTEKFQQMRDRYFKENAKIC